MAERSTPQIMTSSLTPQITASTVEIQTSRGLSPSPSSRWTFASQSVVTDDVASHAAGRALHSRWPHSPSTPAADVAIFLANNIPKAHDNKLQSPTINNIVHEPNIEQAGSITSECNEATFSSLGHRDSLLSLLTLVRTSHLPPEVVGARHYPSLRSPVPEATSPS